MIQNEQFSRLERLTGSHGFEALQKCRVILFGLGGVGSWAAESLIRSGVGHLTIVDSDTVSLSNINRQLVALHSTVGESKVVSLKKRLLDINPLAAVDTVECYYNSETADQFDLESFDFVLDAIDTLTPKKLLIARASKVSSVLYVSMGAGLKSDFSRIRVAPLYKTRGCGLAKYIRKDLNRKGIKATFLAVYSEELLGNYAHDEFDRIDEGEPKQKQVNGTFSHITAIFGNILAGLVINRVLDDIDALQKIR